jgi:hypothetical protein
MVLVLIALPETTWRISRRKSEFVGNGQLIGIRACPKGVETSFTPGRQLAHLPHVLQLGRLWSSGALAHVPSHTFFSDQRLGRLGTRHARPR